MKSTTWLFTCIICFLTLMVASCEKDPPSTQCGEVGQACCNAAACNPALSCVSGTCLGSPATSPDLGSTLGACNGDFTLGRNFITSPSTELGTACDSDRPTNCPDGTFVKFDGKCYCTVACSSFRTTHNPGDNCTSDGVWVCQHVLATNADKNEDVICTTKAWNLCSK